MTSTTTTRASGTTDHLQDFEAFCVDVRGRLVLQAWALTGDLPAAQRSTREALAIAWQHWRRVRRLAGGEADITAGEREEYVRRIAWPKALRLHSLPHLPRQRHLDPTIVRVLRALTTLPLPERKMLLLVHLTTLDTEAAAKEVGLSVHEAETLLVSAVSRLVTSLDLVGAEAVLTLFAPLAAHVETLRWPSPATIIRQGKRRAASHALASVAGLAAIFAVGGVVATETGAGSVAPSLGSLTWSGYAGGNGPYPFEPEQMVSGPELAADLGVGTATAWSVSTADLIAADPDNPPALMPCQQAFTAGETARIARLRTFVDAAASARVGQQVEVADTIGAAQLAYTTAQQWFAGCRDGRIQLQRNWQVDGVGDQASLIELTDWDTATTLAVGLARTGVLTTSVVVSLPSDQVTDFRLDKVVSVLQAGVVKVCGLPDAGACPAGTPTRTVDDPIPVGVEPALLAKVDLPPLDGVTEPWVGTDPTPATMNAAATHCDKTSFETTGITGDLTRTFVIPTQTDLPPEFGLAETVGLAADTDTAVAFVTTVKDAVAACHEAELNSDVVPLADEAVGDTSLQAWSLTVETSTDTSVNYLMAIIRNGQGVAQVGFVPGGAVTMSNDAFIALARRAQARLPQLSAQ